MQSLSTVCGRGRQMITALSGKNSYALKYALDEILARANKDVGELGIEVIDAEEQDVDYILQAVQSLPFLVSSKLVVVRGAGSNAALMNRLPEIADRVADGVEVVLVGPVFDKRKNSYKELKKHTQVREFNEAKPFELPRWVSTEAKAIGLNISSSDASYLVERVGSDQMLLSNELRKLAATDTDVNRGLIDELTELNPRSTVFEMLDAAFSGRVDKAIAIYREQRKKRIEPYYIVGMLTWQLHSLALAVFSPSPTESSLVSAGQSSFAARKALGMARSLSRADVVRYINDLSELDVQIKSVADPDAALELYILGL